MRHREFCDWLHDASSAATLNPFSMRVVAGLDTTFSHLSLGEPEGELANDSRHFPYRTQLSPTTKPVLLEQNTTGNRNAKKCALKKQTIFLVSFFSTG
jgi:hypothetical protein